MNPGAAHGASAPAARAPTHRVYSGTGMPTFGDATDLGHPTATLNSVVTSMARTPDGAGYWLAAADGGIFAYGDARFVGSAGALGLNGPVVGIAATPDGGGYWLAGLDGGVFAYGDARYFGSMGGEHLVASIVAIAATSDGGGYWLAAADGGIFAFGDAGFYGSMGGRPLNGAITAMARTPDGQGYWLVGTDGGIFSYGDAGFYGSTSSAVLPGGIVGIAASVDGHGYWLAGYDGSVYTFGDAPYHGGTGGTIPDSPVSAITDTADGQGYWLLQPDDWAYSFSSPRAPYALGGSAAVVAAAAPQVGGDPDVGQGSFCNPYGPCEPWCALFVTWVWQTAGVNVARYAFTGDIYTWAGSHTAALPPTALPAPGDAVLYGTGPQSVNTSLHTGIVAQVWPDGAIVTVEGDAGPAPTGKLAVITNGPFLPAESPGYNGMPIYGFAQPMP